MKFNHCILLSLLLAFACNNTSKEEISEDYIFLEGFALGATYLCTYQDSLNRNFLMEIDSVLQVVNASLSTYDSTSIISRINNNENNVEPDDLFITCFNRALEIHENTYGVFDMTIGEVVNAYGFGPGAERNTEETYIQNLMQYVGMDKVRLKDGRIIKDHPETKLDAGGIAKGLAVDKVCELFDSKGIRHYIFELSGEVRAKGLNKNGEAFRVGVEKPIEDATGQIRELITLVSLKDKAMATAGNYRRYFYVDSLKYSHIINPKNGEPIRHHLLSATVIAEDGMNADAYATSFMVLGLEESLKLVERLPGIEAYFIYETASGYFSVLYSSGMENMLYTKAEKIKK